ncbi:MAG: hypothetical protein HY717_05015 [Planctomycetes bacterium]|nr:hypothetical protein [Planctomycetota bacterium]
MSRLFRAALLLLASLSSSCIYPTGPIPWDRWRPTYPEHVKIPLAEKIGRIESHLRSRHLSPEGVLVYHRPDREFSPGEAGGYQNLADEAMWTGCLLAAFAFKYSITRTPADREAVLLVLKGLRLLHRVTGRSGLLARAIFPAALELPGEKPSQKWRSGAVPHSNYRYRGDVSKDQYFGVLFGYAVAATVLGIDAGSGDAELRELMAPEVAAIADHIWDNDLRIVDADGETTTFGNLRGFIAGVPIGPNADLCLGWQLLAARLNGAERFGRHYRSLLGRGYHEATACNKFQFLGLTNHNNDNMAMLGLYSLIALESDAGVKAVYQKSLRRLWGWVRHEGNLFFNLVDAARAGEAPPEQLRRDMAETFLLFPVDLRVRAVDLKGHPLVQPSCFRGRKGALRNQTALPLHLRSLSSFIWKSSPYALEADLDAKGDETYSGMDYLLVYWLARYHGLLPEAQSNR